MKRIKLIGTTLFCLLGISCMDYTDKEEIIIYNESNMEIYSILSNSDKISDSDYFAKYKLDNTISTFNIAEIKPSEEKENNDRPVYWDSFFNSSIDKKARLFIISKDSVDKYGWQKIIKNKIYNKRYLLTIDDLKKKNWKIIYK